MLNEKLRTTKFFQMVQDFHIKSIFFMAFIMQPEGYIPEFRLATSALHLVLVYSNTVSWELSPRIPIQVMVIWNQILCVTLNSSIAPSVDCSCLLSQDKFIVNLKIISKQGLHCLSLSASEMALSAARLKLLGDYVQIEPTIVTF